MKAFFASNASARIIKAVLHGKMFWSLLAFKTAVMEPYFGSEGTVVRLEKTPTCNLLTQNSRLQNSSTALSYYISSYFEIIQHTCSSKLSSFSIVFC